MERVAKTVRRIAPGSVVRLGGMTDCFQPAESKFRATYRTIRELNQQGVEYLIVTKSPLLATDEYLAVMDRQLAHIQISISCTSDALARTYERASPPSARIRAVEKLQQTGFDVSLRLSPFIPQFVDPPLLGTVRCDKVLVEFLRVNGWIRRWFDVDLSEYTLHQSGYLHLSLGQKIEYLSKLPRFGQLSVCEDVTEHYHY